MTSPRLRSLQLLGLAARVAGREVVQNIREKFSSDQIAEKLSRARTRVEQARLISENLSQLKGAAMKAGQLLSLDAADLLPPEAVEWLAKLRNAAAAVEWSVIERVLREDLGQRLEDFEMIHPVPSASASIGQVHRGRAFGRDVAVKVQYPGIVATIDSDLSLLGKIVRRFLKIGGRDMDLTAVFDELALVLKQEADYAREMSMMQEFRSSLAGHPRFIVPEAIPSLCASRVLTMSWEEGLGLEGWLATAPPPAAREHLARTMLDLYLIEFRELGLVQTDPNFGNFLIRDQSRGDAARVVLLDFGASLRYTGEFRERYLRILRALSVRDQARVLELCGEFGWLDPRESAEARQAFTEFLFLAIEPFAPERQPFRASDEDYARRARENGFHMVRLLKFTPPPRELIFLHRKLGGIFALLRRLDVELDLVFYWEKMIAN